MKKFFLNLIDANNSQYSSKRFTGLVCLFDLIIISIIATIKNKGMCPDYIFNGILIMCCSAFGITSMENILKKSPDKNEQNKDQE